MDEFYLVHKKSQEFSWLFLFDSRKSLLACNQLAAKTKAQSSTEQKVRATDGPERASEKKIKGKDSAKQNAHQRFEAGHVFVHYFSSSCLSSPVSYISIMMSLPPMSCLL